LKLVLTENVGQLFQDMLEQKFDRKIRFDLIGFCWKVGLF